MRMRLKVAAGDAIRAAELEVGGAGGAGGGEGARGGGEGEGGDGGK